MFQKEKKSFLERVKRGEVRGLELTCFEGLDPILTVNNSRKWIVKEKQTDSLRESDVFLDNRDIAPKGYCRQASLDTIKEESDDARDDCI